MIGGTSSFMAGGDFPRAATALWNDLETMKGYDIPHAAAAGVVLLGPRS